MRKWMRIGWMAAVLALGFPLSAWAQMTEKTNFNESWKYLESNQKEVSLAAVQSGWETISLPHTWNRTDVTDLEPGYRRGAGWYRKNLNLNLATDMRYFLDFEGANITTQVFVNGELAGSHVGGYVGFAVELTDFLKSGDNDLLVRVSNAYDPEIIPSQKSDFYIYGGITRDVWLRKTPSTFVKNVVVSTPQVSHKTASAQFEVQLDGWKSGMDAQELICEVLDPNGKQVFAQTKRVAGTKTHFTFSQLKQPMLWHPDHPHLYTVRVSLAQNGKPVDRLENAYGYRWFHFEAHGAFFVNGERLLLRGTHRHEEHAGYGAAMPNELHVRDMELIREMGANFVRLGHYPQDPEVYAACNRLGLIVWDELPWCRGGVGNDQWKANTRKLLEEMIAQNRNHPSVFFWSLGNEIYWLPDFPKGDDPAKINAFLTELNDLAHQLDPSRLTAIRKYYEGSEIVDVFSPSIWSGWYSGSYKNYEHALKKSQQQYPHFFHAEYGGDSHVGRHTENPINGEGIVSSDGWEEPINQVEVKNVAQYGDRSENYIVDLFDWYLHVSETLPGFAGNAQWAFKDFATPLRPENDIPYMNQKGLLDRAGNPKDAYYVFKSYWSDQPFCYIESHTWTERVGPAGQAREVNVFSNCEEVELFNNGKSLGRKKRDIQAFPAAGLSWSVAFAEGANELKSIGYRAGKAITTDSLKVNYAYRKAGIPEELVLDYAYLPNGHVLVTATIVDAQGLRCLDYEQRVFFQCMAGGETVKHMGTPTGSESITMSNGRAAIEVIPSADAADILITALNQDFKGTFLRIPKSRKTQ